MTHICVVKLNIIGSDNGLSPGRRQAIIWTNAEILLIGPLGTNFIEILIGIQKFSFKKMHFKVSSAKWRPFCLGLNELNPSKVAYLKFLIGIYLTMFICMFTGRYEYTRAWKLKIENLFKIYALYSLRLQRRFSIDLIFDQCHQQQSIHNGELTHMLQTFTEHQQNFLWRAVTFSFCIYVSHRRLVFGRLTHYKPKVAYRCMRW